MFSFLLFLSVLTVDIIRIFWYYTISNILTRDYSNEIGKVLKNIFIKMGPTGIKIGQVLSHRIDILPQNICIILSKFPSWTH